jgi:F-type H+-transporting ATPase subunit delta
MSNRSAASRYARALLDVAVKEADPAAVERELNGFARLLTDYPALGRALTNPAIPPARKRAVVSELLARTDGLPPVLSKLLLLLAERDRLVLLPDLAEAYSQRLMDHQQVVRADVVSAVPLPDDRRAALVNSLAEATGRRVSLTSRVDPAIIGGIVARIGSFVYDGSVTRQLERMKEKLVEGA